MLLGRCGKLTNGNNIGSLSLKVFMDRSSVLPHCQASCLGRHPSMLMSSWNSYLLVSLVVLPVHELPDGRKNNVALLNSVESNRMPN